MKTHTVCLDVDLGQSKINGVFLPDLSRDDLDRG